MGSIQQEVAQRIRAAFLPEGESASGKAHTIQLREFALNGCIPEGSQASALQSKFEQVLGALQLEDVAIIDCEGVSSISTRCLGPLVWFLRNVPYLTVKRVILVGLHPPLTELFNMSMFQHHYSTIYGPISEGNIFNRVHGTQEEILAQLRGT